MTLCFPLASLWIVAGAGVVPALTEELLIPPVSAHKRTSAPAAARKPVTVSSSQEYAGWGGEFLVDEITHSLPGTLGWGSADFRASAASADTNRGEWVMVDLGMTVTVDTVKLYPRDDQEHEGEGFPVDFKIQGATHPGQWVDLVVRTDDGSGKKLNAVQVFTFPPDDFRYIRVVATRVAAAADNAVGSSALHRFQLAEIEVYGLEVDGPTIKDYGLKDYIRLSKDLPHSEEKTWRLVCGMPYNCQFQPWIQVESPGGQTIHFNSSNPLVLYLTPTETVTTTPGERTYEAKNWVSGEGAIYTIPAGVTVKAVKYRETGYDTEFAGAFECNDSDYNILWRKGARTVYLCMRDQFYDCPDRERVGFWGDGTPELNQCFYLFDSRALRLCKDLVLRKLQPDFYPGQHLEFLGEYGLWFYYLHTGDLDSLRAVYDPTKTFLLETYRFGNPRQWFQVDMKRAQTFHKIVLDNTWALWDFPKAYSVSVSNDGVNWGNPVATGAGQLGITAITFPAQTGRHIRITQTGTDSTYHWSIYELDVYR